MIWDDTGFLVSKNKYSENSLIAEIYTRNHGKVTGIIFGGTSRKIKNYLQIGNKLYVNYNSKSDNKIGYFKLEIDKVLTPIYFDDKKKLSCILSAMNLIKILTADSQKNIKIFDSIQFFFDLLESEIWIQKYIFWELELFKNLGYDLEFNDLVEKKIVNNELKYFTKSSSTKKNIPNFLIDKNEITRDLQTLLYGLKLVGDYLDKTILRPNNMSHPLNRTQFINILK
tara:strand:- start:163 stop:843 length:681 start_codon:yes stop_codon:yes gene_type:complete